MPLVRRLRRDEWRAYRALRLRALLDSPDSFGSTFDHERLRPDREWAERVAAGARSESDLPLVGALGGDLVGLAWGAIRSSKPDTARVSQMWVAPESRSRGLGAALLFAIVDWARESRVRRVSLRVACGNASAQRLYVRAGFRDVGEPEPLRPGAKTLSQPMCLDL